MTKRAVTKNDLYAYLIKEAVNQGFQSIPEFVVSLDKDRKSTRKIDLVWARRKGRHRGPQDDVNESHWDLKAAFEIEGCNIPITKKALLRHRRSFKHVAKLYGKAVKAFVVLYTAAHDRKHPFKRSALEDEVRQRIRWGGRSNVRVIDGRVIERAIAEAFGVARRPTWVTGSVAT